MLPKKTPFQSYILNWDEPSCVSARQKRIEARKLKMGCKGGIKPEIGKSVNFELGDDGDILLKRKRDVEEKERRGKDERALNVLWKMLSDTKYSQEDLNKFYESIIRGTYTYPEEFQSTKKYIPPKTHTHLHQPTQCPAVKIFDVPDYNQEEVEWKLKSHSHLIHKVRVLEGYVLVTFKFSVQKEIVKVFVDAFHKQVWDGAVIQVVESKR